MTYVGYTALLMLGALVALLTAPGSLLQAEKRPQRAVLLLMAVASIASAGGGVVGLRRFGLLWPQPVLAAGLAVAAGLILLLVPAVRRHVGLASLGGRAVLPLVAGGGAVFLLPLADPLVRCLGQAPGLWQVGVAVGPMLLLMLGSDLALTRSWGAGWRGLLSLLIGTLAGTALTGTGFVLTVAGALWLPDLVLAGTWVGAVGFLVAGGGLVIWAVSGMAWQPYAVLRERLLPARRR